jgi:hypothetical protein
MVQNDVLEVSKIVQDFWCYRNCFRELSKKIEATKIVSESYDIVLK